MIEEHLGYHRSITAKEAERRLRKYGRHCYLTRYSKTNLCYILSVYQERPIRTIKHFKIIIGSGELAIKGKEKTFSSIRELLDHYGNNRIDPSFENIGRKYTEEEYMKDKSSCCILL